MMSSGTCRAVCSSGLLPVPFVQRHAFVEAGSNAFSMSDLTMSRKGLCAVLWPRSGQAMVGHEVTCNGVVRGYPVDRC